MLTRLVGSLLLALSLSAQAESPYLQPDKVAHYAVGASLAAGGSMLYSPELGLGLAVAYGLGKEEYDRRHPCCHKVERADAGATILGGLIVYAAIKTEKLRLSYTDHGTAVLSYVAPLK